MPLRIPFATKREDVQTLKDAICHAADQTGTSEWKVAIIISHFFESVADKVSAGNVVTMPGFGLFSAYLYEREGQPSRVQPRFIAARPFRNQVNVCCPHWLAKNHKIESYRKSHHPSSRPDKSHSTTFGAMRAFRQQLEAQVGGQMEE